MSVRRSRRPNALKHGGFSRTELLPWEDVGEFEELHRALNEEFEPSGPLQKDCVYTILSCMWRKRRVRDKRNLDIGAARESVAPAGGEGGACLCMATTVRAATRRIVAAAAWSTVTRNNGTAIERTKIHA